MGNKVQVGVHMTPLYLLTNHYFEIFRKKKNSMGKTFSKIEQNRAKFQPIFNLKTVLNSENIGELFFERRSGVGVKISPIPSLLLLENEMLENRTNRFFAIFQFFDRDFGVFRKKMGQI